jgi:glycosyltransferase involved in cell wall biosynthesis
MMKKLQKCTVINFSCRPHSGSEWGVGWNYLIMLSKIYKEVNLYIRDAERQVPWIEKELKELNITNVNINPISDIWIFKQISPIRAVHKFLVLFYFLWLVKIFFILIAKREWKDSNDIFHTTWVSDWIWSPIFLLPFNKRILGPLGSQPINFNILSEDYYKSKVRFYIKTVLRWNPLNFLNALLVDHVIGISKKSISRLPWSLVKSHAIISPVYSEFVLQQNNKNEKTIVFIGKHLAFKNLDLFSQCVNKLMIMDGCIKTIVLGDIVDGVSSDLEILKNNFKNRVTITGKVPHNEVNDILCNGNSIFLQLSSEAGGTAPVEALSCGVPVVCVENYGLDAFFDYGQYPHTIQYSNTNDFIASIKEKLDMIWNDYENKSKESLKYSERFGLNYSTDILYQLIND